MQGDKINLKKCLGGNAQAIFMPTFLSLAGFTVGIFISNKTTQTDLK